MTQPDGFQPSDSIASLAEFAARTEGDWLASLKGAEQDRWNDTLHGLFGDMPGGQNYLLTLLSELNKKLLGLDPTTWFPNLSAAWASLQAWGDQIGQFGEDFAHFLSDVFNPNSVLWNDARAKWQSVMTQLGALWTLITSGTVSAAQWAVWWSNMLLALGLDAPTAATIANWLSGNYDAAKAAKQWWDQVMSYLGIGSGTSLGSLIGGHTTSIGTNSTMLNQISDIFNGLVVTPINTAVQQIKDWWNNLWAPQVATVADQTKKQQNAQNFQISALTSGYRNPTWVCRYPIGDVTYPESQNSGILVYDSQGAARPIASYNGNYPDTAAVGARGPWRALPAAYVCQQNESRGGYVTISNTTVMDTVAMVINWNGVALTANSVFMEVFRENPDLSLTRLFSFDITSSLTTTLQYVERTLSPGLIANAGERYLVRLRSISSTGLVGAQGLDLNPTSVPAAHYTSGSSATNQTAYSTADASTYRVGTFSWALLASKGQTATDQLYADDFNRSGMGSLWFLHSSSSDLMGIFLGQAAYAGTAVGTQHALYVRPTASDRMRVEGNIYNTTLVVSGVREGLLLNCNRDLSQIVYLGINNSTAAIFTGAWNSLTQRASVSTVLNDVPWQFYYDPSTKKYTALKHGQDIGLSWTDSGNLMSHGALYRYGGLRISRDNLFNGGTVDNWLFEDWS